MRKKRDYGWLGDAAKLGGKARWKDVPAEERSAYASALVAARYKRSTKAQRRKAARKAVLARWAKAKKRTKPRLEG